MELFSERNGYVEPSDVLIREEITPEIQNAICSCYDCLKDAFRRIGEEKVYRNIELIVWIHFLNKRKDEYYYQIHRDVVASFVKDDKNEWYRKLDLIEETIAHLCRRNQGDRVFYDMVNNFIGCLNFEFEQLHFAYRIVDGIVVEISSKEEIKTIEDSLHRCKENIKVHLQTALKLYAQKPVGDYRNSIKESISAVEAYCREKTGENSLGKALKKLENSGIVLPQSLKSAFEKLYEYTNQPETGIRHALMEEEGNYVPSLEEALFMLVACSAFVNYMQAKELKRVKK